MIDFDFTEAALAFVAFSEIRTSGTGFVSINADVRFVTVRGNFGFFPTKAQNFAVFADKAVGFFVILHMFNAVFISLVSTCFADFVVYRLDEGFLSVFFQILIILGAFITGIGDDLLHSPSGVTVKPLQKRNQGLYVGAVGESTAGNDIFAFDTDLNVVSGLELSVAHISLPAVLSPTAPTYRP